MGFFEIVRGRANQSQNFGTECWNVWIDFEQSRIVLRIGFGLMTDVFEFRCVFWCLGLFLAQAENGKVD